MFIEPISPSRAAHEVAASLRARIQAGELPVGTRLPSQRDLAALLGVGRQAVREGIAHLEAEGFLVIRRGATGGSFVAEPSAPASVWVELLRENLADLEDILDFRIGIETRIAELAARRRTTRDIDEMRAAIDALPTASPSSYSAFREADGRFHAAIARAARSARLEEHSRAARAELFMPTDNAPYEQRIEITREQHTRIAEAIEAGDGAAAAAATAEHIEESRRQLRQIVGGRPGAGA